MRRMAGAVLGIYGNSKEEAIYPVYFVDADGQKLDGANRYTLRFAPGQLPPVNAFWSLTMYELPASLLFANPLNRYLINSPMLPHAEARRRRRHHALRPERIAGQRQGGELAARAEGPFFAVLRLYWPKPAALDGKWKAPPLQRAIEAGRSGHEASRSISPALAGVTLVAFARVTRKRPQDTGPVTVDNFVRAESDLYFGDIVKDAAASASSSIAANRRRSTIRPSSGSTATRSTRRRSSTSTPGR